MSKLPVSSLRPYLNKALYFTSQAKTGIKPMFSCLYLEGDKAHVYNGETGIIVNFPISVPAPVMLFPFDLARVLNASKDDAELSIDFDPVKRACKVSVDGTNLSIKLMDPANWEKPPELPLASATALDGIGQRLRDALFATSKDASLPKFQAIQVTPTHVCCTDQRVVWREAFPSAQTLLIPKQFCEQVTRLGVEPTGIGQDQGRIFFLYPDAVAFTSRLADETVPDLNKVVQEKVLTDGDTAKVAYDKDTLKARLDRLMSIPQHEGAIEISCEKNVLRVKNCIGDAADTEADAVQEVSADGDFAGVLMNAEIFYAGIERFHQFTIKADGRRLYFANSSGQEYIAGRRQPQN